MRALVENSPERRRAGKRSAKSATPLFAMGGDQFAQRGGQGGMREAIAFYPRQNSFREGLGDIDQAARCCSAPVSSRVEG